MSRASKKLPLHEWYVISLRPLAQHGGVRKNAAKLGARTFALSTVRLHGIEAKASLRQALRCSRVVVTSPAAVRFAQTQIALGGRPGQQWFALGAGSAAALRRCGIDHVRVPARGSDSEALLALDELRRVDGHRIGVITAPGGRSLLASALKARGATLAVAEVYRREPMRPADARLRALDALPETSAVLMTSAEAFTMLWRALDEAARARLLRRCCVVASDRLAARARALGFSTVLRATDARPASLLAILADHADARRFR